LPSRFRGRAQIWFESNASFVAPLTMQLGPQQVLLNAEIKFRRALSRQQLESAIDRVKRHIREQEPTMERIFIDPDAPR
jgi:hypothetical protein